ncbi:MAG TPA: hypothetical protein VJ972_02520 [Anaerolineales bacterium]|nr:hypothetical protein [Anaerolineales bacterium]
MEIFIAVVMAGLIVYEFYTGAIVVQNGARAKAISRAGRPGHFWFWVVVQAVVLVWMTLEWLGVVNIVNF